MNRLRRRRGQGVTLVEILVVSTVLVILASVSLPVLQIVRQREKERRLKAIITHVRTVGIGEGSSTEQFSIGTGVHKYFFGGIGYKNYFIRKIIQETELSAQPRRTKALATAQTQGLYYPLNPAHLVNAQGVTLTVDATPPGLNVDVTIDQRMIRAIPPHPFADWNPSAHWEFLAFGDGAGGAGSWMPMEPAAAWEANWPAPPALPAPVKPYGVCGFRSRGAGLGLNGDNLDDF